MGGIVGKLIKQETRLIVSLIRLGLVLGPMLVAAVLYAHTRLSAPQAAPPSPTKFATAFAQLSATGPTNANDSHVPGAGIASAAAARLMIPPPPQTAATLIDPRRLAVNFKRGVAAIESDYDDATKSAGAKLVSVAAILGYEPARIVIVRSYPRSQIIRSTASSVEAVRYSLDLLIIPGQRSQSNRIFVSLLAAYLAGRHEHDNYARDLLTVLSDDQRLQAKDSLEALMTQLSRVSGACTALSRAVNKTRTVGGECASNLPLQIQDYLSHSQPAGLEAGSRRQALLTLLPETTNTQQ